MRSKAVFKSLSILLSLAMMLSMLQTAVLATPLSDGVVSAKIATIVAEDYGSLGDATEITTANSLVRVTFSDSPDYDEGLKTWKKDSMTVTVAVADQNVVEMQRCVFYDENDTNSIESGSTTSTVLTLSKLESDQSKYTFSLNNGLTSSELSGGLSKIEVYGYVKPTYTSFSDGMVLHTGDTAVATERIYRSVNDLEETFEYESLYKLVRVNINEQDSSIEINENGSKYAFVGPRGEFVYDDSWTVTDTSDGVVVAKRYEYSGIDGGDVAVCTVSVHEAETSQFAITSVESNACSVATTVGDTPVTKAKKDDVVTFTVTPNTGYKVTSAYVVQDPARDDSGTPSTGLTYNAIVSLFGNNKYYLEGAKISDNVIYLGYVESDDISGLWLTDAINVQHQGSLVRWTSAEFSESGNGIYLLTKRDGEYTHTLTITVYDNKIIEVEFSTTASSIQSRAGTYEPERPLVPTTKEENGSYTFTMPMFDVTILAVLEQLHWVAREYHNLSSPTGLGDIEFSVEGDTQHKAGDNVTVNIDYSRSNSAEFDHATVRLRGLRRGDITTPNTMFEIDHILSEVTGMQVAGKTAVFGELDEDTQTFTELARFVTDDDMSASWEYASDDGLFEADDYAWKYWKTDGDLLYFSKADTSIEYTVDTTDSDFIKIKFVMPDSDVMVDYFSKYTGPCTVTFDSNGGSEVAAQENIANGGYATMPEIAPVNNELHFYGWFLNPMLVDDLYRYDAESGNIVLNSFDFANTRITNNITLTAIWGATLTVNTYGYGHIATAEIDEELALDEEYPPQSAYINFVVGMNDSYRIGAYASGEAGAEPFTKWINADTGETYSTDSITTIECLDSNLNLIAVFGHKHNWDVKVNGASMTAQCIDHDGECFYNNAMYTATLTANGGMYNGTPFAATLTLSNEETSPLNYDIDTAIKYVGRDGTVYTESTTAPSAVGKYTATATIVDYDDETYTISKDFEIRQYVAPVRDDDDGGSSGGGGSSSSSNNTVTVSVSSDSASVNVSASVSGTTATVKAPTTAELDKIISSTTHTGEVEINVSGLGKDITNATIPTETVKAVEKAANDTTNDATGLTVTLTEGSVTFDADALTAITKQAKGSTIQLNLDGISESKMTAAQRETARNMQVQAVYDAYLTSNGVRISDFGDGTATVSIPYTLKDGQYRNGIEVWYIANNGLKTKMPSTFDGAKVSFTTGHFSNYVITYNEELGNAVDMFDDVNASDWFVDSVRWAYQNDIMNGVGNRKFNPNGDTSRAMVATMLWRMEDSPVAASSMAFTDVADGTWYTDAVRWANANGIITGYTKNGEKVFNPDGAVTREQLATMLYRYAQYKGVDVSVGEDTNILGYGDAQNVSEYAVPAMQWACGAGIITGYRENGTQLLGPNNASSRAVVATMLMRYFESNK